LHRASSSSLYGEGKRAAAKIVTEATQHSPERPIKMRRLLESKSKEIATYTDDESLALLTDCRLSEDAYRRFCKGAAERGVKLYASYESVAVAKKRCYPENLRVTEYGEFYYGNDIEKLSYGIISR